MNSRYPPLTAEQKRRKQAIRNWKKEQQELLDSYEFALSCKNKTIEDKIQRINRIIDKKMITTYNNLCYSLKDIFREHDNQDTIKYNSEVLCESVVDYLYN